MDLLKKYNQINKNQSLDGTPIDGGTTNNPSSNFIQRYNAENAYYTTNEGVVRANISTNDLVSSTKITALDVEDSSAGVKQGGSGGPNRTNATNQFNTVGSDGTYQNYKASTNPLTPLPSKGEVLTTREDKPSTSELNAYTPQNTYLESMVKFKEEAKNNLI